MTTPTTAIRPDPVLLLPADAPRAEWLAARRGGIGASEIAAVLGISPWESPFSLYWRKVEGWETEDTAAMRAGRYAEAAIADWAEREYFLDEHVRLLPAGLYAHPDRPWQRATPDRIVSSPSVCTSADACRCDDEEHVDELVECKLVLGSWDGWGEPGTDDIPVYYRAQALWQLDVMGAEVVHVAAWRPPDFRVYLIRRDERDLQMMREAGRRFMARMKQQDPPDVDGHGATITALKRLHPSVDDDDVEIPAAVAAGYRRARAFKTRAAAVYDRYEAQLRAALGSGRRAVCDGRTVASRSVYERAGYTVGPATIDRLNPARSKK